MTDETEPIGLRRRRQVALARRVQSMRDIYPIKKIAADMDIPYEHACKLMSMPIPDEKENEIPNVKDN